LRGTPHDWSSAVFVGFYLVGVGKIWANLFVFVGDLFFKLEASGKWGMSPEWLAFPAVRDEPWSG